MNKLAREDQGFVLVTALILLAVMLGLGIAIVAYTNGQQRASSNEQYSEAAFNLAEAALNAQIGQLSRQWPGLKEFEENKTVLKTCTPSTSTKENLCPEPEVLEKAYPNTGATCSGSEAWGQPLSNKWDTYVRADLNGSPYFESTTEKTAASYASTKEKLWVRAVGVVNCHAVTVASLVSEQTQHVAFPEEAFAANWFADTNNGKKVIVNRQGKSSQPGKTNVRCKEPHPSTCASFREGQISPEYVAEEAGSSTTLATAQLEELKAQAKAEGHFYSAGKCPNGMEGLSGKPVYVEGCEKLSFTGNGNANTEAKPGFLLLANGTLEFSGKSTFYGVIYAANLQNSSGDVINLHGNGNVIGEVIVDGNGGVEFGSSKENLEYSSTAAHEFEVITSVAATRNSFRVLPSGQ